MTNKSIKKELKNWIIVVSGIPRSGTSMAMQILEAGGVPVFTDKNRTPDVNNPKGYYEVEAVKRLDKDNSIIKKTQGKAVKVISHLLPHLPEKFKYKLIFMKRDIEEVIRSQQKMLGKDPDDYPQELEEIFQKEINNSKSWANSRDNVELIVLDFSNMIHTPEQEIGKIIDFLGLELDKDAMVSVVDPSLYRSKIE
ncbi:MAG: sulfotransferase domain-containing protein [Promethearchaeia archaeon]